MPENPNQNDILLTKLNLETSRIAWNELLRFFAAGTVIFVSDELDLLEVAVQMSNDNKAQVEQWIARQQVGRVTDLQAKTWLEADTILWTVVVRPWILVQQTTQSA